LEHPSPLVDVTTGDNAVFSCTTFRGSEQNVESLDKGNSVVLFWEIEGLGLHFLSGNRFRPDAVQSNGIQGVLPEDFLAVIETRSNCPREIDNSGSEFQLSDLTCNGSISIPAGVLTNGTAVRCGVYTKECARFESTLEINDDEVFFSDPGTMLVRGEYIHLHYRLLIYL